MFGYIIVHKPELKVREYETYKASYCGLCRSLKKRHGRIGQMTLSYDMTFLALLLTGLYEPETITGCERCIAHPVNRHHFRQNQYFDYAADMNVLLTFYKCLDDWQDEKKLWARIFSWMLMPKMKKIRKLYGEKAQMTADNLKALRELEKKNICDIDKSAGFFGRIMAELFVCREDEWAEKLRKMGFYFGKFIYLMDAYDDVEEDIKKGNYNPFSKDYIIKGFDDRVKNMLMMMMAETCREFEKLPIIKYTDILRNILYSGVWCRFENVSGKRKKEQEKEHV